MSEAFKKFTEYLATIPVEQRASVLARAELLADNETAPEAFEAPIRTMEQYLSADIPVPPILVEPNLIVRGGISVFVSRAGFGKTQFNLNRMIKWTAGKSLFKGLKTIDGVEVMAPVKPLKILVVENEGSAGMFQKQVKKMIFAGTENRNKDSMVEYLTKEDREMVMENMLVWGDGGYSGMKLDNPNKFNEVKAGCEKWEPDIVFFDPLRSLWTGEENSSTEMNVIMDRMADIASDYNCGIIVPHHAKKGGFEDDKMSAARGSTVLEGAVATMESWDKAKNGDFREWSVAKHRYQDGEPVLPIRAKWNPDDQWYSHVPFSAVEESIIEILAQNKDDAMTISELVEETEESDPKVRKVLKELEKAGKVKKYKSQSYGGGSTGFSYRLMSTRTGEEEDGALEL